MSKPVKIDPTFNPPGPGMFHRIHTTTQGNNRRNHWVVAAEAKKQRSAAFLMVKCGMGNGTFPKEFGNGVKVELTRYAPGTLDVFGNLPSAFKHCVDGIADAYGIKDNDPRWSFDANQVRTGPAQYGVRIEISPK